MELTWEYLESKHIDTEKFYKIFSLRNQVFIVEQSCPYQDLDGLDLEKDTLHVVGSKGKKIIAYARILQAYKSSKQIVVGRIIIDPSVRGAKLGHKLMENVISFIERSYPESPIFLSAQAHLQSFYAKHGFQAVSEVYLEDNIPHIGMLRGINSNWS
ncbi:GNAT family N-acetyltransferase [Xenorhabdus budapestensis]|uniref:Protein ElaA n=1 Tax=Xenorhabdus budapestensis TaxID=290110 RepID=A0A2D0J333_XENBU|nr:GNAT family N-acetyltransferase [Xenorhabdus budapestensis]PHM28739.1 GNAT family acetyltransferase [Xenorhabdus budapestensis]